MPALPLLPLTCRNASFRFARSHISSSLDSTRVGWAFGLTAESGRGVSPEPSHRSGRDTLVSSGSCHRAKAAAFRREFELLPLPVGSLPTSVTCPLRSTSITPASSLVRGSPPLSGASVLSASRVLRLCFLPWHRRPGSRIPSGSPNQSHASYTPDTAWPVGRSPPYSS